MRRGYTVVELAILVVILCVIMHAVFCLSNIYQLTKCDFEAPYKAEILRIGGLFVPLAPVVLTFVSNETLGEPVRTEASEVPVASGTASIDIKQVE